MPRPPHATVSGRQAAASAVAAVAGRFPDLSPSHLQLDGLTRPDAALAVAIHRTVLQRWLTLEHLLDQFASKPCHRMEPAMRAVLLVGAAQLLFMQRLPSYAVVDESVSLARRMVRPGAAGMVNAVLRRFAAMIEGHEPQTLWRPGPSRLPLDDGIVTLKQDLLPAVAQREQHLAIATSHPQSVVRRWCEQFGIEQTQTLCHHNTLTPPTIIAVEAGFDTTVPSESWHPHEQVGFVVWRGSHEEMVAFLAGHPQRRVQDPAASRAVASCAALSPSLILDYCAGRGTKTLQMAAQFRSATVLASDPHAERLSSLHEAAARIDQVQVVTPEAARASRVDLLVLDVPCSNTAVLARRPEARYRLSHPGTLDKVIGLQREIIAASLGTVKPGGHLLYSTCSIERAENENQVQRLIKRHGLRLVHESLLLPGGANNSYHDGGYHALLRVE